MALLWSMLFVLLAVRPDAPVRMTPHDEICSEISFEQRDGLAVSRGFTEACQTRATGDAQ